MIEEEQKWIDKDNLKKLKSKLPEECRDCSFLEIINLRMQKVHCAYRINNKCLIVKKKTNKSQSKISS